MTDMEYTPIATPLRKPPADLVAALAAALKPLLPQHSEGQDGYPHQSSHRTWTVYDWMTPDALAAAILAALDAAGFAVVEKDGSLASEVAAEGLQAKALHGEPADRPGTDWLAILAEEFGEVAMEVTKGEVPPVNRTRAEYLTNLRGELVQVASVAMRWLAATDAAFVSEANR